MGPYNAIGERRSKLSKSVSKNFFPFFIIKRF